MIEAGAQDYIKKQEMSPEHIARVVKFSIFRKATEKRLNRLAQYDPLTKLPNRRLFEDRFEHALASAKRNKTALALMFLDLDKFKADMKSLRLQKVVAQDTADAGQFGVTGTPTVFINGSKLKQRSLQGFQAQIDAALAKVQ